jgi:hypothetical protein
VHALLHAEARRLRPAAVGVNLVDPIRAPDTDVIALVERAASLLSDVVVA